MSSCCDSARMCADLARLESEAKKYARQFTAELMKQDKKFADFVCAFNGNLEKAISEYLLIMEKSGKLSEIVSDTLLNDVFVMEKKVGHVVNVKEYGAVGDGVCNDTEAIQAAIDAANKAGRVVHIPRGCYLISRPLVLNGCSLVGEPGNIYEATGTVIYCLTNDFTAISQGSTAQADIMFNIQDITVNNAAVGFEIVYAVNSKFERLYAVDCAVGFQLGNSAAVGCMFCEFNNLYTSGAGVAVQVDSASYFNNNRFNNGFLEGSEYAMKMSVTGGYGAVGNTFNNTEFRSSKGRGIILSSCVNTIFNGCWFECGGNAIRYLNTCSVEVNGCTFGSFDTTNTNGDVNMIYAEGGGVLTVDDGVIFLTANYADKYFFGCANSAVYQNITVKKSIMKNGSATGFAFFAQAIKGHEQVALTGTVTVPANGSAVAAYTFDVPFASVPNVMSVTMRGEAGIEKGLSYAVSERLATGGKISVTNETAGARSVSFSVYAKQL